MSDQHDWGEGALALYEAILQVDPNDEAAAVGRARCLRALGRLEESLAVLETLMKERPDNPVARSQASKTKRHLDARTRADSCSPRIRGRSSTHSNAQSSRSATTSSKSRDGGCWRGETERSRPRAHSAPHNDAIATWTAL